MYLRGIEALPLDVRDRAGFDAILDHVEPGWVFNLAALTSVGASWDSPGLVLETNGSAVSGMLGSLLDFRVRHGWAPRFFQASTADLFGTASDQPRDEATPHTPQSPYARAKQTAHLAVARARDEQDLFACSGILFNHESVLRPLTFVVRKITRAAASIALGRADSLTLGNLDVRRDWGSAADFARAMQLMLSADHPADYVIATGVSRPLSVVLELAFAAAGLGDPWPHVHQDPALLRPADVPELRGDYSKAKRELGWEPTTPFEDVISRMVAVDLRRIETGIEDDPAYL